jgi:hypothetical protein
MPKPKIMTAFVSFCKDSGNRRELDFAGSARK